MSDDVEVSAWLRRLEPVARTHSEEAITLLVRSAIDRAADSLPRPDQH